jgi:transcriptional regulator with XRE-family HTH domain
MTQRREIVKMLKLLRISRGIRLKDIEHHIDISRTFYSNLENGWFARVGKKTEEKLKAFWGKEWTWEDFMREVPEPLPPKEVDHES